MHIPIKDIQNLRLCIERPGRPGAAGYGAPGGGLCHGAQEACRRGREGAGAADGGPPELSGRAIMVAAGGSGGTINQPKRKLDAMIGIRGHSCFMNDEKHLKSLTGELDLTGARRARGRGLTFTVLGAVSLDRRLAWVHVEVLWRCHAAGLVEPQPRRDQITEGAPLGDQAPSSLGRLCRREALPPFSTRTPSTWAAWRCFGPQPEWSPT